MKDRRAAYVPTPAEFRERLLIDSDGRTVPFKADAWQEADFRALDQAWLNVIGRGDGKPTIRRLWSERARGHSKTHDQATMVTYGLLYATSPLRIVGAAADTGQASLLRDAVQTLARCNPWISAALEFQNWLVRNKATGSELQILSSDATTSWGLLPDAVIVDELSVWRSPDLFHSLFSAAAKKKDCIFVAIMNPGFVESWQWKTRQQVRVDASWHFTTLPGAVASWISPARLAEQRRVLPESIFRRLWLNEWSAGTGDAVSAEDLEACCDLAEGVDPTRGDLTFVAGADLGLKRDRSSLCIIACDTAGQVYLAGLTVWTPGVVASLLGRRTVDLSIVENAIVDACERWGLQSIYIDPWQAEALAQNLERRGLPVQLVPQTMQTLTEAATTLIEGFSDRRIHLFNDARLVSELKQLRLVDRVGGYRLDSPRGASGHGDCASSFVLALLAAKRLMGGGGYAGSLEGKLGVSGRGVIASLPPEIWAGASSPAEASPSGMHTVVELPENWMFGHG
jgi:hypothetical protein